MTRQATVLQQNQIDDFWARGFLTVEDLFSPAEVTALREATESEAIRGPQNERGYAEHTVHLLELTVRHPLFMELAKNERILSLNLPGTVKPGTPEAEAAVCSIVVMGLPDSCSERLAACRLPHRDRWRPRVEASNRCSLELSGLPT